MKRNSRLVLLILILVALIGALVPLLFTWNWNEIIRMGMSTIDNPIVLRKTQNHPTLSLLLDWTPEVFPTRTRTVTPTPTQVPPTSTRTLIPLATAKRNERTSSTPLPHLNTALPSGSTSTAPVFASNTSLPPVQPSSTSLPPILPTSTQVPRIVPTNTSAPPPQPTNPPPTSPPATSAPQPTPVPPTPCLNPQGHPKPCH